MLQALRLYLSASGRLHPRAFVLAVAGLYLVALATQTLTTQAVIAKAGLWPFVATQILLTWVWYALHAKRLRDAGYSAAPAAGVAAVYVLALVLFLIVAASFFALPDSHGNDPSTTSALTLLLLLYIFTILFARPDFGLVWFIVTGLLMMSLLPVIVALGFSLWAATRPSVEARAA
jgi:uncharacterized membrane protein YhaH (DUF805 family)